MPANSYLTISLYRNINYEKGSGVLLSGEDFLVSDGWVKKFAGPPIAPVGEVVWPATRLVLNAD